MIDEKIERAAEEYADNNFIESVVKEKPWPEAKAAYAKAFHDGAAFALSYQWGKVEDRLPEEGQRIAVCYLSFYQGRHLTLYMTDKYSSEGFNGGTIRPEQIIAWLPLPEPLP